MVRPKSRLDELGVIYL